VAFESRDAVFSRLIALHPKLIDLSLGRVIHLLGKLNQPHQRLPPVVHVAGTNGKGSVIATMKACLEADGRRVHVYTSPHLVHFHERISLCGTHITEDNLVQLLEECEAVNDGAPITFFEITTVAAFLAFSRTPADILLLETGLGGRLDATNLIAKPRLTVLTPISMDHQQFLGDTLTAIAYEKAGILKFGVPCFSSQQFSEVRDVILTRAKELSVPVFQQDHDWTINRQEGRLAFSLQGETKYFPLPTLAGSHQISNSGTAISALMALGDLAPRAQSISTGLQKVQWPARLQKLSRGKLIDMVHPDWEIWLDGGHNAAAGAMLSSHAKAQWRDRPLYLVSGMMSSKEAADFLRPLSSETKAVYTVSIPGEKNSFSANTLAEIAKGVGMNNIQSSDSITDAFAEIHKNSTELSRILICGSLYLAGTILARNS
tara:strand:+ start:1243 stop:2538 length:1296 start_codon:yes stop_codon:yes gene_type:complete